MRIPTPQASNNVVRLPPATNLPTHPATDVNDDIVARRAFELYCERGREDGHDLDDWLRAEREVRGEATSPAA